MSGNSDREEGIEIFPGVFYGGTEKVDQEKIEARMRLLERKTRSFDLSTNLAGLQ